LENYQFTISPHGTKLLTLTELQSTASDVGGVYVTHDGPDRALAINGGLVDQSVGYSAHLWMFPSPQSASTATAPAAPQAPPEYSAAPQAPSEYSFAELGLMSGAADPMMAFPSGTVFTPYSVVRNISDQPATVTPSLWWMAGGAPKSAHLPAITLPPHRTVDLNAPAMLAAAGLKDFNGSVNLILDTKGQDGALALTGGSVDQKYTYVFEVIPHGIGASSSKSLCYWSTGNGDDTMVTLWNPADEEQQLVFTLFYSGGHYVLPIPLGPRETRTFNISEVLHSAIPDAEGNVVPAGIYEGSAEIAGSLGEHQQILVSMDGGVYNVRKAICGVTCISCNGVVGSSIEVVPIVIGAGASAQEIFYEQWNTGAEINNNSNSSWGTSSTSIATVNVGLVTGVSPGSFTVGAEDLYYEAAYIPSFCTPAPVCPINVRVGGSGGGSVTPTILLGGPNGTNITNNSSNPQNVVAGQQIILYGSYTLPSGASKPTQSWTIPGTSSSPATAISNFTWAADSSSGGPVPLSTTQLGQREITYYWTVPTAANTPNTVTFTLKYLDNQNNPQTATAQAFLTVAGVTSPLISTRPLGSIQITSGPAIEVGDPSTTPGVSFSKSAYTPLGYPGVFIWVQVITKSNVACVSSSGTKNVVETPGLDNLFPYSTAPGTNDSPLQPLPSVDTQVTWNFVAQMYLMWRPGIANDIYVPMGSMQWQFFADGVQNTTTQTWSVASDSTLSTNLFTPGSAYPTWASNLHNTLTPCP
jgi:hypothetical protein